VTTHLANLVARARGEGMAVRPLAASVYGRRGEPIALPEDLAEPSEDAVAAPPPTWQPGPSQARPRRSPGAAARAPAPARPAAEPSQALAGEGSRPPAPAPSERSDPGEFAAAPTTAAARAERRAVAPEARDSSIRGRPERAGAEPGRPARAAGAEPARPGAAAERSRPVQDGVPEDAAPSSTATPAARAPDRPARGHVAEVAGGRVPPAAAMAARTHHAVGRRTTGMSESEVVRISIGRVEVRAAQPAPPPPPPTPGLARPSQSLDDYLRERDRSLRP